MQHAAQQNTAGKRCRVLAGLTLACCALLNAGAQQSLQQALLQGGPTSSAIALPIDPQLSAPQDSVPSALKQMASQAAVIFTGSVTAVTEQAGGVAVVEFAVEEGLRSVASGSAYRIRVSAWAGGVERYHAGERALFFLHAPSANGFSSPVAGELGIVPLSGDALVGNLDLRWIATSTLRHAASIEAKDDPGPFAHTRPAALSTTSPERLSSASGNTPDLHNVDRDLVTAMLRTWAVASNTGAR